MSGLASWFTEHLGGILSKELTVFIISMIPILELRGGMVAAKLLDIEYLKAGILCVTGNLIPIPFILLLITKIFKWMKQRKFLRLIVEKLEKKAMGKKDQIEKYEFWGLVLFVGIPLPGTGAWTGALIASLLEMPLKKAFPAILLGVALAFVIMSIISYGALGALLK